MWKTTQKQIWYFCANTQYCHNTSLLIADLTIKTTMSTQELKKFSEMLAGMRPKFVKLSFTGYNALESYIITQIVFKQKERRSAKQPGEE